MQLSPETIRVYEQLLRLEKRRIRINASVADHFGRPSVDRVLSQFGPITSPLEGLPKLQSLLNRSPFNYSILDLANEMVACEAATITTIRNHVSIYTEHVDDQILFGSRTSGQEAGRDLASRKYVSANSPMSIKLPQVVEAIVSCLYLGFSSEKNIFLSVRSQGACTLHWKNSPYLEGWSKAGADRKFMRKVSDEWIRGILDVVAPEIQFATVQSIEDGAPFGLSHFYCPSIHAQP